MRRCLLWPLVLCVGCTPAAESAPPSAPAPSEPRAGQPLFPRGHDPSIRVCLLWEGQLREIPVRYNPRTGDTIVDGMHFRERFPDAGPYAEARQWFIDSEPIPFEGRRYTRYGPRWIVSPGELRRVGEFDGVVLFADVGSAGAPDVLYVPVRSGCEFQRYQWDLVTGGVRG